jgi:glutathione synthase/RimK-type ligase-like ATP-grasp enzyme
MKLVYAYKRGSKGAKVLARTLGIKRINHRSSIFKAYSRTTGRRKTVINWGASSIPNGEVLDAIIINHPDNVAKAANKLTTLQVLGDADIPIPEWTTCSREAQGWAEEGSLVVCREVLNGHSGEGIYLFDYKKEMEGLIHDNMGKIHPCPLYTKYIKKQDEYRVHVAFGEVIDMQQKRKRRDVDNANYQIRNHSNGFIYAREGLELPVRATDIAISAVAALGLDFGAVDLIYNKRNDAYYVLEVNTACGLEGTTLDKYVEVFRRV